MKPSLILTCFGLMISTTVWAEDTTSEPCANGAGTIVEGAVTGYKYCKSNNAMNWWNAYAWCDAQGKRMIELNDCACGNTTSDCANAKCPEFKLSINNTYAWLNDINSSTVAYTMNLTQGVRYVDFFQGNGFGRTAITYALCK